MKECDESGGPKVRVDLAVGEDGGVEVSLAAGEAVPLVEEEMAFRVGVVAGEAGELPRISIELDGQVIGTFAQTEEGRAEFWNHMDTIRMAQATGIGLEEHLKKMRLESVGEGE